MINATICPPKSRIEDYLAGKLEPEDSDVLEAHLESCQECELTVSDAEQEPDSLVALLTSEPVPACDANQESGAFERSDSVVAVAMQQKVGAYELIEPLGRGGMGTVYLARHNRLDKQVAVKLLPLLTARLPEFVARFEREMKTAGRLEHPAIVRSTDAGEDGGIHYLVMDAIDGMDVNRIAKAMSTLTLADACEIARQAALGLSYAHEQGVVHRDIKPSNLMLDKEGSVRILDFGLAQLGMWESDAAEITTVGQLMGTLDYMAPEQAERGGAVDFRADLYSLGATLFRLLTGRAPLAATPDLTPLEKLRLLSTHRPPKLSTLRPNTPQELVSLMESLLDRDPTRRPASAAHTAELLSPFCASADLPSLISNASTVEQRSPVLQPIHSLRPQALLSPDSPTIEDAPEIKPSLARTIGRALNSWAPLAIALFMLCGGILFVLETTKGQLVIESEDADVQIRLTKDGSQTDELHIQPGTVTTKLRGGKYEIEIDAPSDRFTVSNQEFTIRKGQTIVARISSKPKAQELEGNARTSSSLPKQDERLDEVVYEGKTLDTWLRTIRFERSGESVQNALKALGVLASPELNELIQPALIEFLQWTTISRGSTVEFAVDALAKASGDELLNNLAQTLEVQQSSSVKWSIIDAVSERLHRYAKPWGKADRFLGWCKKTIVDKAMTPTELESLHRVFRVLLQKGSESDFLSPAMTELAVEILRRSPKTTNENFWLQRCEDIDGRVWTKALREEIASRTLAVIQNESASESELVRASIVLGSCEHLGSPLSKEQLAQLSASLATHLNRLTATPEVFTHFVQVDGRTSLGLSPSLPGDNWSSEKTKYASPVVCLLNLVARYELADELESSVKHIHEVAGELALQDNNTPWIIGRELLEGWRRSRDQLSFQPEKKFLCQAVYVHSGLLAGYRREKVYARFNATREADLDAKATDILDGLELGITSSRKNYIENAHQALSNKYAARALPLCKVFVIKHAKSLRTSSSRISKAIELLSRMAGDRFLSHYADCLEQAEHPEVLLNVDFSSLKEFRCNDPEAVSDLVDWCEGVLDKSADKNLKGQVVAMLRSLLIDRTQLIELAETASHEMPPGKVSAECQQSIINRLGKIPFLNNENFWLVEPAMLLRGRE